MNQSQRTAPSSRGNSQREPHKPRRRGTRGAGRRINSRSPSSDDAGQTVHDPAARQQMKQTMAIGLMTNPAIPLPFPLALIMGITTLAYPNNKAKENSEEK
ncbi:hypothetical protein FALBO_13545 [Fusarium albosuccineum]|uniref:Uncharacterized protein n=1 Tax=Fusarium albosuccineum TaxID=1237068 RepID=A0A8H4L106_9HYPO|nr:hypothetical protein FALBO_13545 [Fusarium albosuccineum]